MFHAKLRMGLSANPKRWDRMDVINTAHIGPTRVIATQIPEKPKVFMWPTQWKCRYPGGTYIKHQAGMLGHLLKFMAKDKQRNELIVHFMKKGYEKGRRTAVFVDHRQHLESLQALAVLSGIPVTDIGYYVGGMKQEELDESTEKMIILATYGMMSEGTNIPWLDTAIFGTPRSNIEQTIGRICRSHKGKSQPVAIDLVDVSSKVLLAYANKRVKTYQTLKATIDNRVS